MSRRSVWAWILSEGLSFKPHIGHLPGGKLVVTFGNAALRNLKLKFLVVNCQCLTEPLKSLLWRMEALYCSLWLLLLTWFYSDLWQRSNRWTLYLRCCTECIQLNLCNGMTGFQAKVFPENDAWWFEAEDLARSYIVALICISHVRDTDKLLYSNTQAFSGLFQIAARGFYYLFYSFYKLFCMR